MSLLVVGCLSGATPQGSAVDARYDTTVGVRRAERAADGGLVDVPQALSVRHVHRELLRSVLLDLAPIIAATACYQRNYVERYSRFKNIVLTLTMSH